MHILIHMYSLSSTMTGYCHVCWPHSLPLLLPPWQLYNIHYKFLAINTQLFCTQSWYYLFTPCCSKYNLPNIQCMWQFKGNRNGGLILLSYLSRSRLAIPHLTASPVLSESCKFRHLLWLATLCHANDFWPAWLWGTVVCHSCQHSHVTITAPVLVTQSGLHTWTCRGASEKVWVPLRDKQVISCADSVGQHTDHGNW